MKQVRDVAEGAMQEAMPITVPARFFEAAQVPEELRRKYCSRLPVSATTQSIPPARA